MEFQSLCPILPARDLDQTRAFYEAIGFETEGVWEDYGYLIMRRDGAEVHFTHRPQMQAVAGEHAGYLRVREIDALSDHIAGLGLPGDGMPSFCAAADMPWGMREASWIDPNGTFIRAGAFIDHG